MLQKDPLRGKRIFVGFNGAGAAGLYSWTRVLRRRGCQVDFYGRYKRNFNMPVDIFVETSPNKLVAQLQQFVYFFKILFRYDIWHFNAMSTFFVYPLNLLILKLFGKKIVCTFRGSEVRLDLDFLPKELYQKKDASKWPLYWQNLVIKRNFFRKLVIFSRRIKMKFFIWISDYVVIVGPFLASSVSKFDEVIPYARPVGAKKLKKANRNLTILHSPTDREIKGTDYIEKVFKKLSKKYPNHRFVITDKISHEKMDEEIEKADIVIDQLLVGWYGGFAVEAMAKGKIVLAYMSPPYFNLVEFANEIPIVNSNIWTFEKDLERLLNSPNMCQKISEESYNFTKKYHSDEKIAEKYLRIYQEVSK